jgi:hypothetical protein
MGHFPSMEYLQFFKHTTSFFIAAYASIFILFPFLYTTYSAYQTIIEMDKICDINKDSQRLEFLYCFGKRLGYMDIFMAGAEASMIGIIASVVIVGLPWLIIQECCSIKKHLNRNSDKNSKDK